jgi:hypothetical protein
MGQFDRQIALAKRLIKKYGEPCLWAPSGTPTTADPNQPWISTDAAPVAPTPVFILKKLDKQDVFARLTAGSSVESGGQKAIMAANGIIPSMIDSVVTSDGTRLALQSIDKLAPNGQVIVWFLVFKS